MSRVFVVPILLTLVVLTNAEAQQAPILLVSNIDETQKTGPGSRLVAGESMAAIGFGSGDDNGGYALTGLDVKFHQDQGAGEEVQLELWSSGGNRPYAKLLVFDNPDRIPAGDNTFTLPRPFYLNDGWTYFIVGRAPGYEPGDESTQWWFATTDSDGQSDRIDDDWWIGRNTFRHSGSGAWPDGVTTLSRVPMIAIKGYELDRLVYNTGESTAGYHVVGDNSGGNWLAQVFTTGHDNEGYDLHSVALALEESSGGGLPTDGDHLTASLYTTRRAGSERHPDRKLFDFVSPPVFREGIDNNAFVAPEGSTLERDTRYAFVLRRRTGAWVYVRRTRGDDQDGQDEWWIRNEVYKSTDGATWNSDTRAAKMRFYGKRRTEAITEATTEPEPVSEQVLDIGADRTESEGSNFDIAVTLSATSAQAVSVSFRGTGGTAAANDYGHDGQPLVTIAAGQTTAQINFDITDDDSQEGEEHFFLELHSPANAVIGRARARITIPANDTPADDTPEDDTPEEDVAADDANSTFGTPSNLTATLGDGAVTLSWRAPAATAAIERHEYRYKTDGDYPSTWTPIDDSAPGGANEAGVTVTGLSAGVAHTFQVRAVSTGGEASAAATAATLPVCGRTSQVRDAILARLPGVDDCAEVTAWNLRSIDGEINLHDRGIASLKSGDFSGMNGLEFLKLSGNELTTLPAGVFDGLSAVRELSLQSNDLASLPAGAFRGLTGRLGLKLDNNEFSAFPAAALDDLGPNLRDLNLGYNDIGSLPAGAFEDFEQLRLIDLENNDLTSLPGGVFDGLGTLEYLYLGSNDLAALPAGVFDDLGGLLKLYLANNELTVLPAGVFDHLAALEDLDLGDNDLTALPDGVFDGPEDLKRLYLKGNELTALPGGLFAGLAKLTRLSVDGFTLVPALLLEDGGVAVRVAQGAPFAMDVTLSAEGADLATTAAVIPAGATTSETIAVTLRGGESARGTITVASAAFGGNLDPDHHDGLDILAGASLILKRGSGGGLEAEADETPPVFVSAATSTDGTRVVLTFSEQITVPSLLRAISRNVRVPLDRFFIAVVGVTVDGDEVIPTRAGLSGADLTMTLGEAVTSGQQVAVAYDNIFARDAVGIFIDAAGNALRNFSSRAAANRSTASASGEQDSPPDLALGAAELTVGEGGAATYTVALGSRPTGSVGVRIASSSSKLSARPRNLTFTTGNWSTAQTVTLAAGQDDDALNYWVKVTHTAFAGGYDGSAANVYVVIDDDE